jgi:hypothetical protein
MSITGQTQQLSINRKRLKIKNLKFGYLFIICGESNLSIGYFCIVEDFLVVEDFHNY